MSFNMKKQRFASILMLGFFSVSFLVPKAAFAGNEQVIDPAMDPSTPVVEPPATEIPNPPIAKIPGGALSDMEDSTLKKADSDASSGVNEANIGAKSDQFPKSPIKPNVTVNPNPTGECPVKNPDGSCRKLPTGDPNLTMDDPRYTDSNRSNGSESNTTIEDPNNSVTRDPNCLAWNPDGTCRKLPENPGDPLNRNIHMGYAVNEASASGVSQNGATAVSSISPEALADKAKAMATLPVVEAQNPNTAANGNPASVTLSQTVLNQLSILVGAKKADISVAGVLWTSPDADNNGMFTKHVLLAVKQKDGSTLYYVAVLKGNDPNWTMASKPELADASLAGAGAKSYNPKRKK